MLHTKFQTYVTLSIHKNSVQNSVLGFLLDILQCASLREKR